MTFSKEAIAFGGERGQHICPLRRSASPSRADGKLDKTMYDFSKSTYREVTVIYRIPAYKPNS